MTYTLVEVLLQRTKREHFKYSMDDVFMIVTSNADGTVMETKDLHSEYSNITSEQVARYNRSWDIKEVVKVPNAGRDVAVATWSKFRLQEGARSESDCGK
jgi:hypothetical protein